MKRNHTFTKKIAWTIIAAGFVLSLATIAICILAVLKDFTGGLPYLVSLIGFYNFSTGYVLGKATDKPKAEDAAYCIICDAAMHNIKPNE